MAGALLHEANRLEASLRRRGVTQKKGNWRELCEAATRETDSDKLLELAEKLIKALDEQAAIEKATQKGSRFQR